MVYKRREEKRSVFCFVRAANQMRFSAGDGPFSAYALSPFFLVTHKTLLFSFTYYHINY